MRFSRDKSEAKVGMGQRSSSRCSGKAAPHKWMSRGRFSALELRLAFSTTKSHMADG